MRKPHYLNTALFGEKKKKGGGDQRCPPFIKRNCEFIHRKITGSEKSSAKIIKHDKNMLKLCNKKTLHVQISRQL